MEKIIVGLQNVEGYEHELSVLATMIPNRTELKKVVYELENLYFQFDSVDGDSVRASLRRRYEQVWSAVKALEVLGWNWNA